VGVSLMDADWSVELGADDPVLEFPWSSPDGLQHYVDLRQQPHLQAAIPEAKNNPELWEFLREINSQPSPWTTVKCDVWLDDELGEAEAIYDATLKFCCYVDLIARDETARWSFERHEAWVKSAARKLDSEGEEAISSEFILRRCWYHPVAAGERSDARPTVADAESLPGFYVTLYVSGYGGDEAEARTRWARGLRLLTPVLLASGP
jgi:hypothetical protein